MEYPLQRSLLMQKSKTTLVSLSLISVLGACGAGGADDLSTSKSTDGTFSLTLEEFIESTYKEPFEDGVYIVDGDRPVSTLAELTRIYESFVDNKSALAVNTSNGQQQVWDSNLKLNLTYCVSTTFGSLYEETVVGMNAATAAWEAEGNINFIHLQEHDSNCSQNNQDVLFDVRPVSGAFYIARAFFPGESRAQRNVLINNSAYNNPTFSFVGILMHELGHTLGFRHEHTRPGGASNCYEDNNWTGVTSYDPASIMHYPHCNGTNSNLSGLSILDGEGMKVVYGDTSENPPTTEEPNPPEEPSPPAEPVLESCQDSCGGQSSTGSCYCDSQCEEFGDCCDDYALLCTETEEPQEPETPQEPTTCTASDSDTLLARQQKDYAPFFALAGQALDVSITGTGDADLYVKLGSQSNTDNWDCRPFTGSSNETCSLTVPPEGALVYISVRGYADSTFALENSWACEE